MSLCPTPTGVWVKFLPQNTRVILSTTYVKTCCKCPIWAATPGCDQMRVRHGVETGSGSP